MRSSIERLQKWYSSQCDGNWEHEWGVRIETLDNPGWALQFDISETNCEDETFETIDIKRSGDNWVYASREENTIKMACGVSNLEESLLIFLNWAENSLSS